MPARKPEPFDAEQRRTIKQLIVLVAAVIWIGPALIRMPGKFLSPDSPGPAATITTTVTLTSTITMATATVGQQQCQRLYVQATVTAAATPLLRNSMAGKSPMDHGSRPIPKALVWTDPNGAFDSSPRR
jgi:hypothetical protein